MKTKVIGAAVAAALLGLSPVAFGQTTSGSTTGAPVTSPATPAPVTGAPVTPAPVTGYPVTGSSATGASGGGVGGSAGGTGASPVDTPRESNRSAPGANPDVTGPQGSTARCDAMTGAERTRCLREARPSTGGSTGIGGVGGSAGGTGASPVDTPREANRSAPGGNADVTGPDGLPRRAR